MGMGSGELHHDGSLAAGQGVSRETLEVCMVGFSPHGKRERKEASLPRAHKKASAGGGGGRRGSELDEGREPERRRWRLGRRVDVAARRLDGFSCPAWRVAALAAPRGGSTWRQRRRSLLKREPPSPQVPSSLPSPPEGSRRGDGTTCLPEIGRGLLAPRNIFLAWPRGAGLGPDLHLSTKTRRIPVQRKVGSQETNARVQYADLRWCAHGRPFHARARWGPRRLKNLGTIFPTCVPAGAISYLRIGDSNFHLDL